ncbi:MAG: hypothetical protein ACTSO9_17475, partial [Candidatus Helarchaeota archaeon]
MNNKIDYELDDFKISYSFRIIDISKLDPKPFIDSKDPEVNIFGLLTNINQTRIKSLLWDLIERLKKEHPNELAEMLNKIIIVSRLRRMEVKLEEVLKEMELEI